MDIAKVFNDKAHKFLLCFRSKNDRGMQAFPEIEILEGRVQTNTVLAKHLYR